MGLSHLEGCANFVRYSFDKTLDISIPNFRRTHIYPIINDFKYKTFKVFVPAGSSNIL